MEGFKVKWTVDEDEENEEDDHNSTASKKGDVKEAIVYVELLDGLFQFMNDYDGKCDIIEHVKTKIAASTSHKLSYTETWLIDHAVFENVFGPEMHIALSDRTYSSMFLFSTIGMKKMSKDEKTMMDNIHTTEDSYVILRLMGISIKATWQYLKRKEIYLTNYERDMIISNIAMIKNSVHYKKPDEIKVLYALLSAINRQVHNDRNPHLPFIILVQMMKNPGTDMPPDKWYEIASKPETTDAIKYVMIGNQTYINTGRNTNVVVKSATHQISTNIAYPIHDWLEGLIEESVIVNYMNGIFTREILDSIKARYAWKNAFNSQRVTTDYFLNIVM